MRELNKNEKIFGSVILGLLFVFAFNLLIISPLKVKLELIEQDTAKANLLFKEYSQLEKEKGGLLKEYKTIKAFLDLKGSDNERMAAVLSSVESEARKSGLTILDMKPLEDAARSKVAPIIYRIQLSAEADAGKIIKFLHGVGNANILFNVDKLNINVKDEDSGVLKFEAVILGIYLA
jgi:Tfp pilus assembly protein PilO